MNNIISCFVPYKESIELKEIGFDEPCIGCYYGNDSLVGFSLNNPKIKINNSEVKSPLYQQIFQWFIDKYNLYGVITIDNHFIHEIYGYEIYERDDLNDMGYIKKVSGIDCKYQSAQHNCLKYLIKIVKENENK